MLKEKVIKFCDILLEAVILAIIFLVPLFFSIQIYNTFELDKIALFRILVELALGVYLAKTFLAGEIIMVKSNGLFSALALIFFSQVVSVFFSEHRLVALWGTYSRNFGLFTYLHFYIFTFLVFDYLLVNPKGQKRIIWAALSSGFLVSVYGLIQATGNDFLKWQSISEGEITRVSSTLGQPNFLGSYLLFVLPLAAFGFLKTKKIYLKLSVLAVLSATFLCLLATYSRAAWLGLIFASIIWLLFLLYRKKRSIFYFSCIFFSLSLSFFVYLSFVQPVTVSSESKLNLENRIRSLANIYQGSSMIRLYYYEAAVEIIKNAPLIGHGLDTQQYYFFKYYQPDYAVYETINAFNDRAHNELLDILITGGLLGLAAWLFLIISIVKQSYLFYLKNKDKETRLLVGCLLFGLTALSLSLLFGFFTLVLFVYFWLFCAMLFAMFSQKAESKVIRIELRPTVICGFLILWFMVTAFLVWNYNIRAVMASYYYRQSLQADLYKNYSESFRLLNKTIEYLPNETFYHSQSAGQLLSSAPSSLEVLNFAEDLNLAVVLSNTARLKIEKGEAAEKELAEAEEILRGLIKEAPGFSHFYLDWGNLYFYQKKYDQALDMYYQALGSYPDLERPEMNSEHRQQIIREVVYVYIGIIDVKIAQQKYEQAIELCKKALRLDPTKAEIIQRKKWLEAIYNLNS
ncbi:MAG: hypothetical protein US81_C0024G0009 [Parcubacteria group bacterium GW2011_GWE2_38_18]|nr:MAG: hypothetical protein US81_C0024G0009 [Parcubacteria group bacterium GW2011_GWE2_38_18]